MKRIGWACVVAIAVFGVVSARAASPSEDAAQAAAESWLKLVDAGNYEGSWDLAASGVRTPLGKLSSRKMKSREYTEKVPGGPDGKYVVIQFDTVFEKKAPAVRNSDPDARS